MQFTEKYIVRHTTGLFEGDYTEYETFEEANIGMHTEPDRLPVGYGPYGMAVIRVMEVVQARTAGFKK